jgi:hypothetical protein
MGEGSASFQLSRDMKDIEPDSAHGAVSNGNRASVTPAQSKHNSGNAPGAPATAGLDTLAQLVADAEAAHVAVSEALRSVGRKPPAPPTARGFLGEKVLEVIQPLFGWYTHGLRQYFDRLETRSARFLRALQAVATEARDSNRILQNQQGDIAKVGGAISDLTSVLQRLESRLESALRQSSVDSRVREDLNAAVIGLTAKVRALEERADREGR